VSDERDRCSDIDKRFGRSDRSDGAHISRVRVVGNYQCDLAASPAGFGTGRSRHYASGCREQASERTHRRDSRQWPRRDACASCFCSTATTAAPDLDACTASPDPDACPAGPDPDACTAGSDPDACPAGSDPDACPAGPDPDACTAGPDPDAYAYTADPGADADSTSFTSTIQWNRIESDGHVPGAVVQSWRSFGSDGQRDGVHARQL